MSTPRFGIGTYQSVSGGTTIGSGFSTQPLQLNHPYGGIYGGTYGYVLNTKIRQPGSVQYHPAPEVGLDGTGKSIVRSYPAMQWQYSTLRPDYWYYLQQIYQQSTRTPSAFQYLVLLQYADPQGSGGTIQSLARMDPPTHASRTVAAYTNVTLTFTYIGMFALLPSVPIVVL